MHTESLPMHVMNEHISKNKLNVNFVKIKNALEIKCKTKIDNHKHIISKC